VQFRPSLMKSDAATILFPTASEHPLSAPQSLQSTPPALDKAITLARTRALAPLMVPNMQPNASMQDRSEHSSVSLPVRPQQNTLMSFLPLQSTPPVLDEATTLATTRALAPLMVPNMQPNASMQDRSGHSSVSLPVGPQQNALRSLLIQLLQCKVSEACSALAHGILQRSASSFSLPGSSWTPTHPLAFAAVLQGNAEERTYCLSEASNPTSPFFPYASWTAIQSVAVHKRKKSAERGQGVIVLDKTVLGTVYHLPLKQAANELGICPTAIKTACRKLGLPKWPYRTIRKEHRRFLIDSYVSQAAAAKRHEKAEIRGLERSSE